MKMLYANPQYAKTQSPNAFALPRTYQSTTAHDLNSTPISQQVITWMLLWPLLTLVARRTVYFGGPPADEWTYLHGSSGAHEHAATYINLLFLTGFALAGNLQLWRVLKQNPLIPSCLMLAAASALWSASPLITLKMLCFVSLSTLFACYLSTRLTTERLMSLLMFVGAIAACLSILFVIFLPRYGVWEGGEWQGITNGKNTLGLSMAFLLTPVFFAKEHRIVLKITYAVSILFLIGMSRSRGAWLVTAGMLFFVGWLALYSRLRSHESYILLGTTLLLVVATATIGVVFLDPLARMIGKDPTLTGRTGIYAEVIQSILKHPFLGYGFGAFWFGVNPESTRIGISIQWTNIGYAENGILELALQLGLLGVGVVMTMIGRAALQAGRLIRSPFYNPRVGWFATILVLELLTNIDAGWLMAGNTLDWLLTLIACIGLASETQRAFGLMVSAPASLVSEGPAWG